MKNTNKLITWNEGGRFLNATLFNKTLKKSVLLLDLLHK